MVKTTVDASTEREPTDLQDRLEVLRGAGPALVLTHDYPDPDALASGVGIARMLEQVCDLNVTVGYGGFIGRAENRAMVFELGLRVAPIEHLSFDDFEVVALVDTQPQAGNNALPPGKDAHIVVDHHPPPCDTSSTMWCDIRPEYGAAATIVHQYLRKLKVPIDSGLATALYYAIKTETNDLIRETHAADVAAYRHLFGLLDRKRLAAIVSPPVSPDYFLSLSDVIRESRIYGPLLVAPLARVPFPELVAEMADILIRHRGISWCLAIGRFNETMHLSLRSRHQARNAGELLRRVVTGLGSAGGHGSMAGGQVPLDDSTGPSGIVRQLTHRICAELAIELSEGQPIGE